MAHYLVTGGCGFIGSHLVDGLEHAGHRVTVLDDLSTGRRDNLSPATTVIVGTVTDPSTVAQALHGIDGVFHLAAIASVERSREEWRSTHATNQTGFINILDTLAQAKARVPVVYASSAAVYGDVETAPIAESQPLRPLTAYGADKLGCELHAHVGAVVHRLPSTGLRFFNVYGPRQDPRSPYSGVISVFCDRLRRGQPIQIHGDGMQQRDFIFVGDVVEFLMRAMATTAVGSRVFNVCTGTATSVLRLAQLIAELCNVAPEIEFQPARPGDIRVSLGAPNQAETQLGERARVDIRDGLMQTLAWMAEEGFKGAQPGRARARPMRSSA
jgi:UDP-glucose 4-epimerase